MKLNESIFNAHWNDKKLSELGCFQRGKSKHRPRNDPKLFIDGKYPLIQTGEVKEANLYINSHKAVYNDFGLSQSKLWPSNTLCITIAANIAETALLKYPMCFPDSIVGFNAYPNETSEIFMYYIFEYIKRSIQNAATGSIQDNINIEYLMGVRFKIPDRIYQDKITDILLRIDQKIELNNRINAELVAMAKTLYDYWFVQFDFPNEEGKPYQSSGGKMVYNTILKQKIPDGWIDKQLSDVVERIGTGLNPRDNFKLGEGNNYYITIKDIEQGRIIFSDKTDRVSAVTLDIINKRSDLKVGDILFTSIQPVGLTYLIHERPVNWNINESVFTIRANQSLVTNEYLFELLSSEQMKVFSKNSSSGSIHKGIRHGVLKTFVFAYADLSLIKKFTAMITPTLQKQYKLGIENNKLQSLRDWLLPMLMSGQVTVK